MINKNISKEIFSFSFLNMFGNASVVVNRQGLNFIINYFCGVAMNAAVGIATTISSVISGLVNNVLTAFRPQVTKSYAKGDLYEFHNKLLLSIKLMAIVYFVVAIPFLFMTKDIMDLWLVETPYFADVFCKIIIINVYFETLRYVIIMGVHAVGNIKFVSISTGVLFLVSPICVYFLMKAGYAPSVAYISNAIVNAVLFAIDLVILKRLDKNLPVMMILIEIVRVMFVALISSMALYFSLKYIYFSSSIIKVLGLTSGFIVVFLVLVFCICFNRQEQRTILRVIKHKK